MTRQPTVVVVGGGFGGLTLVRKLHGCGVTIILVDKRNYHLFQPLLYQVATAALPAEDIAEPLRSLLRDDRDVSVLLDEAIGLDLPNRTLTLRETGTIEYDMLVLATGVEYNYFGHPEWAAWAPSLKSLADAMEIRRRILLAFEEAENTHDPERRRHLMTFVLVGGGPTGVELAGSIAELARFELSRDFRRIDPTSAHVVLVEAGPKLLAGFTDRLSNYALRALQRLGVDVRLSTSIESIDETGALTKGGHIAAGLVVWCAGVRGTPVGRWLGADGRHGTVEVMPDLSAPDHPEVFVIGDLAQVPTPDGGGPLPQVAAVAKQEGAYVAQVIAARVAGRAPPPPFQYRDPGSLAIVGRAAAVVQMGRLRLTGLAGWLVWAFAHIFFLIGFRNRLAVFLAWAWEWLTFRRGARLIPEELPGPR